ncbi:Protein tyrosine phosphatase domain-containing protein 1 [Armadillidium vulgare]|nr:Protein tyrosine phosphatase domain-containing protein 1 [Armadillidium vulgare]
MNGLSNIPIGNERYQNYYKSSASRGTRLLWGSTMRIWVQLRPQRFYGTGNLLLQLRAKRPSEPTLGGILDMVKVMAFSLTEGKVAVHCHAGLGRTGVLISCYLVYSLRVRANDAIRFVHGVRPCSEEDSGFTGNEEFSVGDVSAPNSAQYPARRLNQDCESPDVPSWSLVILPKKIYEALLVDHALLNTEYKKKLRSYRIELNIKQSAWDKLKTETDLYLLTGLLFTWFEHLKQPILAVDALSYVVLASHKPEVCLRKMEKEVRYTLEYLVRFVSRLQPLTRDQTSILMRRMIAALTQQAVQVGNSLLPADLDIDLIKF